MNAAMRQLEERDDEPDVPIVVQPAIIPAPRRTYAEAHFDEAKLLELLHSEDRKVQKHAIFALRSMLGEFGELPSCVNIKGLVGMALDAELAGKSMVAFEFSDLFNRYIEQTSNISPLLGECRKKMEGELGIHDGVMIVELCHSCVARGKITDDVFAIINIALRSPAVQQHSQYRAIEAIDMMLHLGVDSRKVKKSLKKASSGTNCIHAKYAAKVYARGEATGFQKPPNWFVRKRDQFNMWMHSRKKIVKPEKIKRT